MLVVALCLSVVLEWLGMAFVWPELGVAHSERMLERELMFVHEEFGNRLIGSRPAMFAATFVAWIARVSDLVGIERLLGWLEVPAPETPAWQREAHFWLRDFRKYLKSMVNIVQLFAARLVVLTFATPVFALFALVGIGEGLMRRDLRRWGGGRESSFVYHHSKKLVVPSILAAWMLYLAMPISIHPNLVLLPFAVVFAAGVATAAATFKKYL